MQLVPYDKHLMSSPLNYFILNETHFCCFIRQLFYTPVNYIERVM